ncbi:hypothetical protein F4604DRAFT_71989 [Suillus subluteus]|nr:hypothetical protein F4604DRAFT_71989 [Suillus subluteus]
MSTDPGVCNLSVEMGLVRNAHVRVVALHCRFLKVNTFESHCIPRIPFKPFVMDSAKRHCLFADDANIVFPEWLLPTLYCRTADRRGILVSSNARFSPWLRQPKPPALKINTSLARPGGALHVRSLQIARNVHPFRALLRSLSMSCDLLTRNQIILARKKVEAGCVEAHPWQDAGIPHFPLLGTSQGSMRSQMTLELVWNHISAAAYVQEVSFTGNLLVLQYNVQLFPSSTGESPPLENT